jgi:hypothetical protein
MLVAQFGHFQCAPINPLEFLSFFLHQLYVTHRTLSGPLNRFRKFLNGFWGISEIRQKRPTTIIFSTKHTECAEICAKLVDITNSVRYQQNEADPIVNGDSVAIFMPFASKTGTDLHIRIQKSDVLSARLCRFSISGRTKARPVDILPKNLLWISDDLIPVFSGAGWRLEASVSVVRNLFSIKSGIFA